MNLTNDSYIISMGTKNFTERYYRDKDGWLKVSARGRKFRMTAEQVLNHLLPAVAGVKPNLIFKVEHRDAPTLEKPGRLYTLTADTGSGRGYRRLPLLNGKPSRAKGALVRLYVFANSPQEARQRAQESLRRERYRVLNLSMAKPNGSKKVWPMDDLTIGSANIARAQATGEVLYGWVIEYDDDNA